MTMLTSTELAEMLGLQKRQGAGGLNGEDGLRLLRPQQRALDHGGNGFNARQFTADPFDEAGTP